MKKRVFFLCVIVVFVRIEGFSRNLDLPNGARGICIAAGMKK